MTAEKEDLDRRIHVDMHGFAHTALGTSTSKTPQTKNVNCIEKVPALQVRPLDHKPQRNMNMEPKKIAFVAMPFGTKETGFHPGTSAPSEVDFDALWNLAYYPALTRAGYQPVRADTQEGSLIIQDMVAQLMLADLVVADISIPNANVYYETGLRHGGSTQGCLLFSADWASPVFDLAQIRRRTYPLGPEPLKSNDYEQIQEQIFQTVSTLDASSNPVRELIDSNSLARGHSSQLEEARDAAIKFQTDVRACKMKTNAWEAKRAVLQMLKEYNTHFLPSYATRELFELIRDVLGWQALIDFYAKLGDESRKLPFFREQIALAKCKTGDTAQAISEVETLIEQHGQTGERSRLLGWFYKHRYFELDSGRKKQLALKAAIQHYEKGFKLDLNDYGCARNLLVLYPLRNQDGDADAAANMAAHILYVCDHKELLNTHDKWVPAARLLVAFHAQNIYQARSLADSVALAGLANWELALCIEFLELLVEQIPRDSQDVFHSLIEGFKYDISIDQAHLVKSLSVLLLETGRDYRKCQNVKARPAREGEKIVSTVESGRETVNTAGAGDYVVENQTGAKEQYIVSRDKFKQRYSEDRKIDDEWSLYKPLGLVKGIQVDRSILNIFQQEGSFYITASWGEAQKVDEGDMLVTTLPLTEKLEIYRIARKEFSETYTSHSG